MEKKLAIFTAEGTGEPLAFWMRCEDGDFATRFRTACETAVKAGWKGSNTAIPAKYLKAAGLSMRPVESMVFRYDEIGDSPVSLCACRQCSAYEEGNCFRYGGTVDGFATSDDLEVRECIHGTGGVRLEYDGAKVSDILIDTGLDPAEAVKYILGSGDEELASLKEEIEGFLRDEVPKGPLESLWEFRADGY